MNEKEYREAMDRLPFSEDFEARTIELLRQKAQPAARKENETMTRAKHKKVFWRAAIAVCLAVVLSVTGIAASQLLSAREASRFMNDSTIETAFSDENAIEINETQVMGDYTVTLLGVASGKSLQKYGAEDNNHSYVLFAVQGNGLDSLNRFAGDYTITPLVSGYHYEIVNCFSLGMSGHGAYLDDTLYLCEDIANLELLADHTIYWAIYKRDFPVYVEGAEGYQMGDVFTMAEDGSISFREDFPEDHAMFTLPLDESKADPAAAEEYLWQLSKKEWSSLKWLFPEEYGPSYDQEPWEFYDENYHERQQKALEDAGLK